VILWLWSIILSASLLGNVEIGCAESSVQPGEGLASLVSRFLDTGEGSEAERFLQAILADDKALIFFVSLLALFTLESS